MCCRDLEGPLNCLLQCHNLLRENMRSTILLGDAKLTDDLSMDMTVLHMGHLLLRELSNELTYLSALDASPKLGQNRTSFTDENKVPFKHSHDNTNPIIMLYVL